MSGIGFFELLILLAIFVLVLGPRGAVSMLVAILVANSKSRRKPPTKDQ
jgi:Sec-independent protein translocase protein TatA